MTRRRNKAISWAALLVMGGAIGVGVTQAEPSGMVDSLYISSNGPTNAGDVVRFESDLERRKVFDAGNNEGVELDTLGNLFQAGDIISGTGTLRVISQIRNRPDGTGYADVRDRELGGDQTTLVLPKGIAIAQTAGFVIVADNGLNALKVFGTSAGGNVPPVAVTNLPAKPWDAAYDEASDRLFVALVDGNIVVFDNYIGDGSDIGASGVARTFFPANASNTKVSTNLHGIVYDRVRDVLVVTDVGAATAAQSPDFNRDGRIYVLPNASSASGAVQPTRTIQGDATTMGNPVDIIVDGTDALVAEKANDRLLRFANVFEGPSGNIAPDQSVAETKPESLVAAGLLASNNPDITDIEESSTPIASVVTTGNPPAADEFVSRIAPNLQSVQTTFSTRGSVPSIENITFDQTGDAFITFDDGLTTNAAGGILVVNRLAKSRDGGTVAPSRDRTIAGPNTRLISPKGLDIADSLGLVMVAENGPAGSILAFSTQASGNVAPVFVTTDLGGRKPWDVDYDPASDRLFVAATDGTVLVYDDYATARGADGPDRVITPTAGATKISVNLHGIIYVASSNTLLLSDVGSATSATDGQLFVLENADAADGNVAVRTRISGPDSRLGNPVDITFDGRDLYVAEKSNDVVLRYDDILRRSGSLTDAADASFARNKPESVALVPDFVSRPADQAVRVYIPLVFK